MKNVIAAKYGHNNRTDFNSVERPSEVNKALEARNRPYMKYYLSSTPVN